MSPRSWETVRKRYIKTIEEKLGPVRVVNDMIVKLIERRIKLRLTQSEVARRAGIKQSALARIENFGIIPRMDTLLKLSNVLGLEISIKEIGSMRPQLDYNHLLIPTANYDENQLKLSFFSQISNRYSGVLDVKSVSDYWNEINKESGWTNSEKEWIKYNVPEELYN